MKKLLLLNAYLRVCSFERNKAFGDQVFHYDHIILGATLSCPSKSNHLYYTLPSHIFSLMFFFYDEHDIFHFSPQQKLSICLCCVSVKYLCKIRKLREKKTLLTRQREKDRGQVRVLQSIHTLPSGPWMNKRKEELRDSFILRKSSPMEPAAINEYNCIILCMYRKQAKACQIRLS